MSYFFPKIAFGMAFYCIIPGLSQGSVATQKAHPMPQDAAAACGQLATQKRPSRATTPVQKRGIATAARRCAVAVANRQLDDATSWHLWGFIQVGWGCGLPTYSYQCDIMALMGVHSGRVGL